MAFGKNIAKAGSQAERVMSQRGLDSAPQDPDTQEAVLPGKAPAPAQHAPPVNPFGGSAFSPGATRPSPAPQAVASRPASAPRATSPARPEAFGRPQPPRRPAPGPASRTNRPASSPAQGPASSAPPERPQRAAPVAPSASTGAFGASAASDPPPSRAPEGLNDLFQGYTSMIASSSRREDGLSLRLERLIDEVSDFLGYDDDRREEAKKRALTDPTAWDKKLTDYYVKTIRPNRAKTARTLEEARQKNPGKIVYLSVEKGNHSIKVFDRDSERGQQEALLDGSTLEVVASSRTPFPPPRDVFGSSDVSQEMDADVVEDAFSGESAPLPLKSPRP